MEFMCSWWGRGMLRDTTDCKAEVTAADISGGTVDLLLDPLFGFFGGVGGIAADAVEVELLVGGESIDGCN